MKLKDYENCSKIKKENFFITLLLIFKSSQASILAFSPITTIIFLIPLLIIFYKVTQEKS